MNVVIYARFSSSRQQEQSIDGQIRACQEYADKHGYTVIRSYCDRAISGTTDERPEFQRMIEDAAKGQFKYILVWKLDRFSRNRYDSAVYKRDLQKHGVRVLSVTEGIGDGEESIILEAIIEAMAEQFSRSLSRNVKRGMRESALQGKSTGGHIPFGYRSINKKYVVVPEEADLIKQVFQLYASGQTKSEIARRFGKDHQQIDRIIRNKRYTGTMTFDGIESKGVIPMIIDEDLYEQCQNRLKTNPKHVRNRQDYFLAGKAFCGHCGKALKGTSASGNGGTYYYYICDCGKKRETKSFLEEYATKQACDYVLDPANTDYIAHRVAEQFNADFDVGRTDALKSRLSSILTLQNRLVDKLIDPDEYVAKAAKNRFDELTEEHRRLEAEIERLEKIKPMQSKDVRAFLSSYCQGDPTDPEFQKQIIDTFVNCLYVWDDKLLIYFNVKQNGDRVSYTQAAADVVSTNQELVYHLKDNTNLIISPVFLGLLCGR